MAFFQDIIGKVRGTYQLWQAQRELGKRVEAGLRRAANYLHSESLFIAPMDTGNMAMSSFVRKEGSGMNAKFQVVYPVSYSVPVHEDLDRAHGKDYNRIHALEIARGQLSPRRPQEQAKFLEAPMRDPRVQSMMHKLLVQEVTKGGSPLPAAGLPDPSAVISSDIG
jgi:hypothetical protein